jgi:serine phosphatase RsbU (regulator of sigma subunit)/putative methionine-R-sulfoxide reductase with GAF domain
MTKSLAATTYVLAIGLCGIGALVALTDWHALSAHATPLAFFVALSFVLKRAGFHAAPEVTHSLVGIIDLAAVLIFGPILGAWVAAVSGFLYLFLNAARHERHTVHNLIEMPVFNAGLKIGMAYASTHAYTLLGGKFPPLELTAAMVLPILAAAVAWFVVDHLGWGILEFLRGGKDAFTNFIRTVFVYSLLMELLPLPFAFVIAAVYASRDLGVFLMMAAGLVGTAIIVQRFADTSAHLERRSQDLTTLNTFGQAVSRASLDAEKIVDLLHEHARRIVLADLCRIELVAPARAAGTLLALEATPAATRHPYDKQADATLLDYFAAQREPIRAVDIARSFVYPFQATGAARAVSSRVQIGGDAPRSALIVPMFAGDELVGILSLFSAQTRVFYPIHARNLTSMGAQAAVAIQNARLYADERKRAAQLGTISEVSRQIAAFLDLDELLQNVVNRVRERFGYTHVHVFTVDKESGYVVFRASTHPRGVEWRARGIGYRIGLEGIVGWVAAMGEPLLVNDVTQEPRFAPYPDKAVDETRSEIVVPLTIGEEVIGVLDVESDQLNAFDDEDLFILKTLAAQVAIALQDARLYNSQREEAYYLNVLLQVAENLAATTDLDEALETVVRITPLLVGVERCAVLLYHAAEQVFVAAKAYGLSGELQEAFLKLRLRADEPVVLSALLRDRAPILVADAATSPWTDAGIGRLFGNRALLVAPLMTRGEVVGAMIVDQGGRARQFTQHETEVVMGIANQAAVAIEGAQLARAAEEKKRFEYELGLAQQIQKSFLPAACPTVPGYEICSLWQTAREVSGDFYDFVTLHGGRLAITIADVSDKGMAAALFMALARTILRTMTIGKPTTREAVERANDVILADARSEMFVTVFCAVLDPQQHRLTYVNAGHNPPLLYRATHRQVTTLEGNGIALGVLPNISLEEFEIQLAPGDLLLMYTDGVTDAINAQEEEFGADRLADLVATRAQSAEGLIAEIKRAVWEFAGEGINFDDVTMVALKRVSSQPAGEIETQGATTP